ncbi:MAG: tyrosine-type recombinase/integrase [Anaerolineae bacterium]|nr:tyrosine-type recombinase/integrase [Anaerolineae bacterium]
MSVFETWLATLPTAITRNTYVAAWASFRKQCDKPVEAVTRADVEGFRTWLIAERSSATASLYIMAVSSFYQWAVRQGHVAANPCKGLGVKASNKAPEFMTAEEGRKFLAAIDRTTKVGRRDYALLLLIILTGLRSREAREIKRGDLVDRPGGRMGLQYRAKADKHVQTRTLPTVCAEALKAYLADQGSLAHDAPIFVTFAAGGRKDKPLSAWSLSRLVEYYSLRALGRRINPHALRHAAAEILYDLTGDVRAVGELLGHKSLATTEIYLRHLRDQRAEAGDKIAKALGIG